MLVCFASTSVTKYLIVSLVYFSDSTWQKSQVIPGTPPVFAMHSRRKILRTIGKLFRDSS